jgi:hypothetical protein
MDKLSWGNNAETSTSRGQREPRLVLLNNDYTSLLPEEESSDGSKALVVYNSEIRLHQLGASPN